MGRLHKRYVLHDSDLDYCSLEFHSKVNLLHKGNIWYRLTRISVWSEEEAMVKVAEASLWITGCAIILIWIPGDNEFPISVRVEKYSSYFYLGKVNLCYWFLACLWLLEEIHIQIWTWTRDRQVPWTMLTTCQSCLKCFCLFVLFWLISFHPGRTLCESYWGICLTQQSETTQTLAVHCFLDFHGCILKDPFFTQGCFFVKVVSLCSFKKIIERKLT